MGKKIYEEIVKKVFGHEYKHLPRQRNEGTGRADARGNSSPETRIANRGARARHPISASRQARRQGEA